MRFALTDEQRALQDAVRSYLRDRFGPRQLREMYEGEVVGPDATDGVPPDLWKSIGEQGWLAVLVPEQHDGIGLGVLDAAVIARAFGAGTVPGPWLGTVLLGEGVRLAGSAEQQAAVLPGLAAGQVKGAVALLAPGAAPAPVGAPARPGAGGLTGRLELVEYPAVADTLLVATPDGGLHLVDPRGPGVGIRTQDAMDRTTRLGTVELEDAPAQRLAGSSPAVLQQLLDRAAVLVANDLVGVARRALTDTVAYDKTRVQFGKPVGSFQAVKHELADLHLAVTMAEHAATYAAHALDLATHDQALAVSVAKSKAGDTARAVVSALIQLHGGIGYTWEHDAHFCFKRAKRLEYAYGDAAQHRERIAALLLDTADPAGTGNTADPADGVEPTGSTPGGSTGVQGTGVSAGAA